MSIWFVTPAWKRYELTAVCLEQRQFVIEDLARRGIESYCVVIADDENLDIAREWCMDTVEQNNDWLGRRFNDGIEYAAKHGAEWIVPIGSDSWIDPNYFVPLPERSMTSSLYAVVTAERMALLSVGERNPAGPHMIHRSRLPYGFRPAKDELNRYIDSSTLAGLREIQWHRRDKHPLQYIGFRGEPHLTPYDRLWKAWGVREDLQPWETLKRHYPTDLVERARTILMQDAAMSAAAG